VRERILLDPLVVAVLVHEVRVLAGAGPGRLLEEEGDRVARREVLDLIDGDVAPARDEPVAWRAFVVA
jgi:hypothetical protein